jgi:hypothetical protein
LDVKKLQTIFAFDAFASQCRGLRFLRQHLPDILAKRIDVLSPRMIRIIQDLSADWRRLDECIEHFTEEIEVLARSSENCQQLMPIPGIGPLIASAGCGHCQMALPLPRDATACGSGPAL